MKKRIMAILSAISVASSMAVPSFAATNNITATVWDDVIHTSHGGIRARNIGCNCGINDELDSIFRRIPRNTCCNCGINDELKPIFGIGKIDIDSISERVFDQSKSQIESILGDFESITTFDYDDIFDNFNFEFLTPEINIQPTETLSPIEPNTTTQPIETLSPIEPEINIQPTKTPDVEIDESTEKENTYSDTFSDISMKICKMTNIEREKNGLSPLVLDKKLNEMAQYKAEDMAVNGFSHEGSYGDFNDLLQKYNISYGTAAENIAKGQQTPEAVMNSWMNSSGHRANILNENFTKLGVGYTEINNVTYWVMEFTD